VLIPLHVSASSCHLQGGYSFLIYKLLQSVCVSGRCGLLFVRCGHLLKVTLPLFLPSHMYWEDWEQSKQWRTEGMRGFGGVQTSWNSKALPKLSRISSSVEYTSITTRSEYGFHSFANWVEPLTRGLPPSDPHSLCPLSSTEFVEPPPPTEKIPGYATDQERQSYIVIRNIVIFKHTILYVSSL
jgi:hypothetical protein